MTTVQKRHLAYLTGIALGDGNLSNPNGRAIRLRVTCFSEYPRIAQDIEKTLAILFPTNRIARIRVPRSRAFNISVYSNKLEKLLPWKVGLGSKIKQKARVPKWIKNNKTYSKLCLRGLIQTDGCIYHDRGYLMVNFTNNIRELAEDVRDMLQKLGFRVSFGRIRNGYQNFKYTVRVAKDSRLLVRTLRLYKE